jgi:DNA-binding transcriptional LysR family regulator
LDPVEPRRLRSFLVVAEELHFGRAATRLQMAQPPLSQQIRRLERELGVELFDRSRRQIRLTSAGRALRAEGERALAACERATHAARQTAHGEVGQLEIGCVSSAFAEVLVPTIRRFRALHPEVGVVARHLSGTQQVERLQRGELDAGFIRPLGERDGVVVRPALREPLLAAVPADHRLAGRASVPLGELAADPFVAFARARAPRYFDQLVEFCTTAGFTPTIAHEATDDVGQLGLVACGLGVALVARSTGRVGFPGVVYVPLEERVEVEILLATPAEPPDSLRERFAAVVTG